MARISFTPAPGVNVSDADAVVTDVKDPKTFYSVAAPRKTGTMPTEAIVAGAETYAPGYHAGNVGGLSAIDADLAVGNIKKDVNIFGKVGTFENTISLTELWNAGTVSTGSVGQSWKDMTGQSDTVPASAKQVQVYVYATVQAAYGNGDIQILYNGVQKATIGITDGVYSDGVGWGGAGIGSEAAISCQCKLDSGTGAVYGGGACWYQTVA